jgi:hypothetical protein
MESPRIRSSSAIAITARRAKFLGAISQTVKKIPLGVFTRSAYGFCHGALGELLAGAQQAISS